MKNLTVGNGWTTTEALDTSETLVVRGFDVNASKSYWLCMNMATRARFPLWWGRRPSDSSAWHVWASDATGTVRTLAKQPSDGSAFYCPKSRELIFLTPEGIVALELEAKRESLLYPLDANACNITLISASPDGKSVCYLQQKRAQALHKLVRLPQDVQPKADPTESTLFKFDRNVNKSTAIAQFAHPIHSSDINWEKGAFFAIALDAESNEDLFMIDLSTSKLTVIKRFRKDKVMLKVGGVLQAFENMRNIAVMENGDLLLCSRVDAGIHMMTLSGKETEITSFGGKGTLLHDRTNLAFTRRDPPELWLKEGLGEPSLLIGLSTSSLADNPVWCLCGNHLSVVFHGTGENRQQILVVADVRNKKLVVIEGENPFFSGRPVWLPAGLLKESADVHITE